MNQQKYIRIGEFSTGTEVMILLPPIVTHANLAFLMGIDKDNLDSAGFVSNGIEDKRHTVKCHGKSSSLGLECRPGDSKLVKRQHYAEFKEQKYVRFESLDGCPDVIILIPNMIQHSDFVDAFRDGRANVVTAGFVDTTVTKDGRMKIACHGFSYSLNVGSGEAEDARLIERQHYSHLFPLDDGW